MSEISIRTARPDDAEEMARLLVQLGYPDNREAAVRRRLETWTRERSGAVFVAERVSRVVATIAVAAVPYLEREGCCGRIVALVTAEECRGRGIGRRLVEAAEQAAAELGCVTMEVTSARARTESHPFYRSLGYADWGDRSVRYLKNLTS